MKVVAHVADVTKNLASVMEMADRGNWVMFHKDGEYIQTMKPEEETKMKTIMNTMTGSRVPIFRKGHDFIVESKIKKEVEKKEVEYIEPRKIATKRWSNMIRWRWTKARRR